MARKKANNEVETKVTENEIVNGVIEEDDDIIYDPDKVKLDLDGLASLSKETKKSAAYISDNQIRLIIDNFYQTQHHRMNVANQIRAVNQGFDQVQENETPAIAWLLKDIVNRENQIKKMICEYAKTVPVCQWAMSIKGIGPIFAANLWSYIDTKKCKHANQWLSYAGLNDNNAPWLGKEKATIIVNDAYEQFELKSSDKVTEDVLLKVANDSGRNVDTVRRGFKSHRQKDEKAYDKTVLIKYLSKPPYNTELKKICYLIGQSFIKVSNRGSLYGQLYKERKAYETMKNENGDYAEQAKKLLSEKNYATDTETYKYLSQGKLSPAHINARAMRWAVKIFMTHFFEMSYRYTHNNKKPPVIYPIAFQGHVDYIEPEVPYENFLIFKKIE